MYISTHGQEGVGPRPTVSASSGSWYNLKSEISGTNVKIYINDKLVKEITMSGSGTDSKTNNYVGIWCHTNINTKGDSFQGKILKQKFITLIWLKESEVSEKSMARLYWQD